MAAYLQWGNIDRILFPWMPAKHPPPGTQSREIAMAMGAICGARDAGRQRCINAQKAFRERGLIESKLEGASIISTMNRAWPPRSFHAPSTSRLRAAGAQETAIASQEE